MLAYVAPGLTVDGGAPQVKTYYLQQNEITGQLAAGNGTNPRFDGVYVRISEVDGPVTMRNFEDATGAKSTLPLVVDRRSKLEWVVVQGTPAAMPQIPAAPDATWARWGVWYVPKNWATSFQAMFSNGGSNVADYRIPADSYRRHLIDVAGMYAGAASSTAVLNAYNGYASFTGSGPFASIGATCPVRGGRIMGFSWTPILATAGYQQRLMVRAPGASSSMPTNAPWFASIYGGIRSGDPTIPITDLDNFTMSGGEWSDPSSGSPATTTASGLALLPLWANGHTSEAEDPAQVGGFGLAAPGEYTMVQGVWIPNAATDRLVACVFDVAG